MRSMRIGGWPSAPLFERSEFCADVPKAFGICYFLSIEKVTNTVQKHTAQEKDSLFLSTQFQQTRRHRFHSRFNCHTR